MRHDTTKVLAKHITELFQILERYKVCDKHSLVNMAKDDIVFQKATLMTVGYIGELSKKIDEGVKSAHPGVNWRRLGTSRNIIFHEYDIVDMEIIASVIFRDITGLRDILQARDADA